MITRIWSLRRNRVQGFSSRWEIYSCVTANNPERTEPMKLFSHGKPWGRHFLYEITTAKWMLLKRGAGSGERKSGNELSAGTCTKIQNGGPKNEREKEEDQERNSCLGWNQVGTKLQIRLPFYVYVLSRWYVFSIFNLFHLQYDKDTHITPGLLRLL